MTNCYFLSVDFQYDFVEEKGKNPCIGTSPAFVKERLLPWLKDRNIKIHEIVSDYRLPRGKSINESCVPGTVGFKSLIPDDVKLPQCFIKCMHNPTWNRDNIGDSTHTPGDVYPMPERFTKWLDAQMPNKQKPVVLFGETLECCILNVAQELYYRGYKVYIIYEASDPMKERQDYKDEIAFHSGLSIYATVLHFDEIEKLIVVNRIDEG